MNLSNTIVIMRRVVRKPSFMHIRRRSQDRFSHNEARIKEGFEEVNMGIGTVASLPIMLTCLCNVYPLSPHFYIVKVGFTGVLIIFLLLL